MRINGTELDCEILGAGEPVVCIHGALIADTFRPLLDTAGVTDRYRFILYHRRGYLGSSRPSGPVSIDQQAADCRELLRCLGIELAHVVGHSYGGTVAVQLALDDPSVVHSLAVLEPALMVGESAQNYRESLVAGLERYREAGAAVVVDEFLEARLPGYRTILERAIPGAFDQAVTDAETWFECELSKLLDWRFSAAEAKRIGQPVLSVLGGDSPSLSPRFGETHHLLLEWLPHVEGFVLPGTTHFLQIQDPLGMAEALTTFWSRHSLSSKSPDSR